MDKCPVCGYDEKRATTREHNIMNQYVNADNKDDMAVFNSTEAVLKIGSITYNRMTNSGGNIKESKTPTHTAPAAPVVIKQREIVAEPVIPAVQATPTVPKLPGA